MPVLQACLTDDFSFLLDFTWYFKRSSFSFLFCGNLPIDLRFRTRRQRLLEAQAHAALVGVDADNAQFEFVTFGNNFLGVRNTAVGQFADMDQPLDTILVETGEGTK